ncbi:Tll0287-like domain-containing protein [Novipirellula artificiosorum]|uniref:Tll0287-like domain-containing protein n=1 Tax=Novipirellula artificiosorum TaxID=2528016 RepID=A0A5C6D756_9BACT|nr:DUF3365 domain-containing protein [Novipirellula artificiosorum]TWU33033.1 hypothetical protein Poly41_54120 [Novipirellula artificiosorum]
MNALKMLAAAGCVLVIAGCSHDASPSADSTMQRDPKAIAMAAKEDLYQQLSGRLMQAMTATGPAAAINVCSKEAPKIAETVSQSHGVRIGRTSAKLRNPENAPDPWVAELIHYDSEMPIEAEPKFEELADGGLHVVLPIRLQATCLMCHGPADQISDDVKAQLETLYPDDQATGFNEGDLRGWFWIEVPAA